MTADYDLLIIGGGINGTAITRNAAGRGLKVLLVRKALNEREILLHAAPHIIHPLKFILPHEQHLRPM